MPTYAGKVSSPWVSDKKSLLNPNVYFLRELILSDATNGNFSLLGHLAAGCFSPTATGVPPSNVYNVESSNLEISQIFCFCFVYL